VAEDDAFWQHEGVDFEQLQESPSSTGAWTPLRGGSTITQQLAKNLYRRPDNPAAQKLRELVARHRGGAEESAHSRDCNNVIEWVTGSTARSGRPHLLTPARRRSPRIRRAAATSTSAVSESGGPTARPTAASR
jgi:hypothetical protein